METTSKTQHGEQAERWPALPYEAWRDTCQTLHLWTQIVGKSAWNSLPFSTTGGMSPCTSTRAG